MSDVVHIATGRAFAQDVAAVERAREELARNDARLNEERRRDRERKRAWRYLRRGGVLLRHDVGGAVGVRWGRPTLSGLPFDPVICERWRERGRLEAVPNTVSGWRWREAAE